MKKTILLFTILSLIGFHSLGRPAADFPEILQARLAGLCKLWGAVKYFHPYLVYKDIDWDQALIETLPKVRQAANRYSLSSAPRLLQARNPLLVVHRSYSQMNPRPGSDPSVTIAPIVPVAAR